jgi:hypothetical protein
VNGGRQLHRGREIGSIYVHSKSGPSMVVAVAQRIVSPRTMRSCVNASFRSALGAIVGGHGFIARYSFNNL